MMRTMRSSRSCAVPEPAMMSRRRRRRRRVPLTLPPASVIPARPGLPKGPAGTEAASCERANRDHRETGIELNRSNGVARRRADERQLEARMGDRFVSTDEAGAELDARRAHLEVSEHCLAPADPARDKHRNSGEMRQDL